MCFSEHSQECSLILWAYGIGLDPTGQSRITSPSPGWLISNLNFIYNCNSLCHVTTHRFQGSSVHSVQSLSRVRLFATPWIAAHQASLSITNSWREVRKWNISRLKCLNISFLVPIRKWSSDCWSQESVKKNNCVVQTGGLITIISLSHTKQALRWEKQAAFIVWQKSSRFFRCKSSSHVFCLVHMGTQLYRRFKWRKKIM